MQTPLTTTMEYITLALTLLGILSFITAMIVQVIKELPVLKRIPTGIVALAASLILCPTALLALCAFYKIAVTWYYVAGSLIAAFIVYLIATGGWERITEIWNRTRYRKNDEKKTP